MVESGGTVYLGGALIPGAAAAIAALRADGRRLAFLSNKPIQTRADYAAKLTRHAWKVTPEDLARLHELGFDDRAILQINLVASWFNYINRVADGLGVGRWQG